MYRWMIVVGALALLFAPFPAQAGILELFFPSLKSKEHDPTPDGMAPFAYQKEAEQAQGQNNVGSEKPLFRKSAVPFDKPHRMAVDISEWLVTVVSESITFEEPRYQDDLKKTVHYFSKNGRESYRSFMSEQGVAGILESKKYYIRNFVEEVPILLNEGPVDGRYRWLYEVPVMLTYMDRSMLDYKGFEPETRHFLLTVQIGRSPETDEEIGVLVERWSGKAVTGKKKK